MQEGVEGVCWSRSIWRYRKEWLKWGEGKEVSGLGHVILTLESPQGGGQGRGKKWMSSGSRVSTTTSLSFDPAGHENHIKLNFPFVPSPVFSNGTGRSISKDSRHTQVSHLCLDQANLCLCSVPRLSQGQQRPRMAVHIGRAFAVQSSQLFAAIREVNHNTCYGVETRRGRVDSAGAGLG